MFTFKGALTSIQGCSPRSMQPKNSFSLSLSEGQCTCGWGSVHPPFYLHALGHQLVGPRPCHPHNRDVHVCYAPAVVLTIVTSMSATPLPITHIVLGDEVRSRVQQHFDHLEL